MWIDKLSRREAIGKGVVGVGGMILAGCGGGSVLRGNGGGGTSIVSRKQRLAIGTSPVAVTTEIDGTPVKYLFGFADTGIQGCCWGKAASDGTVETAIEVLAWDDDVALGSRTVFDARALPSRVARELNGAFMTILWDASEAIFKLYLKDGSYAGGARVVKAGSTFDVVQLPDSPIAGHYLGTLANSRDGVFSLTAGVLSIPAPATARKAARSSRVEPSRSRAVDNAVPTLTAILSAFGDGAYPPLAGEILAAMGKDYFTKGHSDLFMRVVEIATDATGTGGQFFTDGTQNTDRGASLLRGLLVAPKIRQIVSPLLVAANGGQAIPTDQLFTAEQSPIGAQYVDSSQLTEIKTGSDRSLLRGTLSARDFGTVSVYGVVDPSGAFKASGSLGNSQFQIAGTLTGTTLTGTWTSNVAARDGGGDMSGNQQPLGQCMSQQLSGGQGIFINSYDMGSCGGFDFTYQAFTIPDRFTILNSGQSIFDTGGLVSGGSSIRASAADNDTIITVIVTASESGTAWNYQLGCPNS